VTAALDALGIPHEKRYMLKRRSVDFEGWARARLLDIDGLLATVGVDGGGSPLADVTRNLVVELNQRPFRATGPVIGIYGKAGQAKGTPQLAEALAVLAGEGFDFTFLPMCSGWRHDIEKLCRIIIENKPLSARTWILPPLCPWRVPEFLARCDIVAFLENNFSIDFHTPQVPLEIVGAKRLMMLSTDQHKRLPYRDSLIDGRNIVLVDLAEGPKDIVGKLRELLTDRNRLDRVRSGATTLPKLLAPFSSMGARDHKHPMLEAVEEFAA
jgi:hypothetical protein